MGGIQLQRQADHALQRLDHLLHQGRLIHTGRTHVHIQDLGPGLGLAHGLFQHIVHIPFPQGLLEPLLPVGLMRSPTTVMPSTSTQSMGLHTTDFMG